jgi:hypothetical protein
MHPQGATGDFGNANVTMLHNLQWVSAAGARNGERRNSRLRF